MSEGSLFGTKKLAEDFFRLSEIYEKLFVALHGRMSDNETQNREVSAQLATLTTNVATLKSDLQNTIAKVSRGVRRLQVLCGLSVVASALAIAQSVLN